jgi:hypothetical protein
MAYEYRPSEKREKNSYDGKSHGKSPGRSLRRRSRAAVDLLLAHGADKTIKDKQGKTASGLTSLTALRAELAPGP